MVDYGRPFKCQVRHIKDEWIDYNGHFNMAYYNVLFDQGGDDAFDLLGLGPAYVKAANCSFFTLEAHVSYVRELHRGDAVQVTMQILDHDPKRIHYFEQMYHADEGWLAATLEGICMHVDMAAKKSSPFPDDVIARIAAMQAAHKDLPVPPQVGHRIGIRRKNG